jgi:serine/threonine protein kinase
MGPLLGERYRVVHPLWRDRLGETHVARDERTGYPVAVRLLRGDLATCAVARRMREEYDRLVGVRDPHLAAVLDLVEDRDVLVIVSEVVEGPTLRRLPPAVAGVLSAVEIGRIGAGVAAGLEALHEAGMVHGHLGRGSVVLGAAGEVRLTDIGPAHVVVASPAGRQALRAGAGRAPELAAGAVVEPAVDMYALGTLLAELSGSRWPSPTQRLARRLRARDPRGRPSAQEVRTRLCAAETGDGSPTRPAWRGLARVR